MKTITTTAMTNSRFRENLYAFQEELYYEVLHLKSQLKEAKYKDPSQIEKINRGIHICNALQSRLNKPITEQDLAKISYKFNKVIIKFYFILP